MRIEVPITVVKANLENEEVRKLNEALDILAEIEHVMTEKHFTECICTSPLDEYLVPLRDISNVCGVLETLTLLTGLQ